MKVSCLCSAQPWTAVRVHVIRQHFELMESYLRILEIWAARRVLTDRQRYRLTNGESFYEMRLRTYGLSEVIRQTPRKQTVCFLIVRILTELDTCDSHWNLVNLLKTAHLFHPSVIIYDFGLDSSLRPSLSQVVGTPPSFLRLFLSVLVFLRLWFCEAKTELTFDVVSPLFSSPLFVLPFVNMFLPCLSNVSCYRFCVRPTVRRLHCP